MFRKITKSVSTFSLIILLLLISSAAADTVIKTFSGSDMQSTRPFNVADKWEVQWDAKGDAFALYLYSPDGTVIAVLANQDGPGKGSSYQAKGGNYYLRISAMGDWAIDIVQVGNVSTKRNNYEGVESYKDSQLYKAYSELPDKYKTIETEKLYKNSYAAENKVKNFPCSEGGTIEQFLNKKAEIPAIEDLGWNVYPWEDGFEVERRLLLDQGMSLEYKWHVDNSGKVKPLNGKAIGITSQITGKPATRESKPFYRKSKTTKSSGRIFNINDIITLSSPSDTVVAIYKDESLDQITRMFTNGIEAKVIDYKSLPDKPVVYKIQISLQDGTEYTGWVTEGVLSD